MEGEMRKCCLSVFKKKLQSNKGIVKKVLPSPSTALGLNNFMPRRYIAPALAWSLCMVLGLSNRHQQTSDATRSVWGITSCIENLAWLVVWLVKFIVLSCTYREVHVVEDALEPLLYCNSDVTTLYVLSMEKHDLEFVTSTRTMSCNIFLRDCTRHTRTLPLLTNVEAAVRPTSMV
jgi:hypothetical protein